MPKPDKHRKRPTDVNQLAHFLGEMSTSEEKQDSQPQPKRSPVSEYLAKIGRKGGLKGGKARAKKLSAAKRTEIARNAAESRWAKQRDAV